MKAFSSKNFQKGTWTLRQKKKFLLIVCTLFEKLNQKDRKHGKWVKVSFLMSTRSNQACRKHLDKVLRRNRKNVNQISLELFVFKEFSKLYKIKTVTQIQIKNMINGFQQQSIALFKSKKLLKLFKIELKNINQRLTSIFNKYMIYQNKDAKDSDEQRIITNNNDQNIEIQNSEEEFIHIFD